MTTPVPPDDWPTFAAQRTDLLTTLVEPVRAGVRRVDTAHPAFHGCVDWHSAVHATYALLAVARLTGEPGLAAEALHATGGPERVAAEVAAIGEGRLPEEIPYGMAWALVLDAEAARAGIDLFADLAHTACEAIVTHLAKAAGVASNDPEYANLLWPLVTLGRWAAARQDGAALAARDAALPDVLAAHTGDSPIHGFFSPPHLAALLLADLGREPAPGLLETIAATTVLAAEAMPTVHAAGLNFSRAWGTYAAYRATDDVRLRDLTAALVLGHAAMPDRWRDDYQRHSHWVPQFGIFAIAETLDTP